MQEKYVEKEKRIENAEKKQLKSLKTKKKHSEFKVSLCVIVQPKQQPNAKEKQIAEDFQDVLQNVSKKNAEKEQEKNVKQLEKEECAEF